MKRKLTLIALLLVSYISFAQFEVRKTSTDELITDGQTINFNESGCGYSDPCNWKFKVTNTSGGDIYMRIFVDGMTNTDGSNFQLCFAGVCLNSVTLGSGYPTNAALIPAGATNSAGNNFWNQNPSGTTTAMSWTFRFQAFDAVGGSPIGTPLSVTYNYDPNLSTESFEQPLSVDIFPSIATNEVNIISQDQLKVDFYNLLGQNVKKVTIEPGNGTINVSDLAAQPYILRITNNKGEKITKKIVIK